MAVYNTAEVSGSQGRPFLNKAVRTIRCIAADKMKSKKGNDMIVFKYEIVSPESENNVRVAGLQLTDYIVLGSTSSIPLERLGALTKIVKGNPMVDIDNPAVLRSNYVGKAVRAEVKTEAVVLKQVDEDGIEQPVMDDNGNPVTDNNYRLGRFIGADDKYTIPADSIV
jgi:hypothetical protein